MSTPRRRRFTAFAAMLALFCGIAVRDNIEDSSRREVAAWTWRCEQLELDAEAIKADCRLGGVADDMRWLRVLWDAEGRYANMDPALDPTAFRPSRKESAP